MPTTGDKYKKQTQRKETSQQTSTKTKRKTTTRNEAKQGREGGGENQHGQHGYNSK